MFFTIAGEKVDGSSCALNSQGSASNLLSSTISRLFARSIIRSNDAFDSEVSAKRFRAVFARSSERCLTSFRIKRAVSLPIPSCKKLSGFQRCPSKASHPFPGVKRINSHCGSQNAERCLCRSRRAFESSRVNCEVWASSLSGASAFLPLRNPRRRGC